VEPLDQWEPEAVSLDFDRRLYRSIEESGPRPGFLAWCAPLPSVTAMWRPVVPLALRVCCVAGVMLHAPQAVIAPVMVRRGRGEG